MYLLGSERNSGRFDYFENGFPVFVILILSPANAKHLQVILYYTQSLISRYHSNIVLMIYFSVFIVLSDYTVLWYNENGWQMSYSSKLSSSMLKQKSGGDSIEGEILHQHNTGGTIVS